MRLRQLASAATGAIVAALAFAAPTAAATAPVNITGIEVKNGNLIGLVTSSSASGSIDSALTVTVAGKDYPVWRSRLPEGIRMAHLIGQALVLGESKGRA